MTVCLASYMNSVQPQGRERVERMERIRGNVVVSSLLSSDQDIDSVGQAGSPSYSNSVFTVNGAGSGIGDTTNSFHFCVPAGVGGRNHRGTSGQCDGSSTEGGVMITEMLTAGSADAGTAVSACAALSGKVRLSDGSRTPEQQGS